MSFVGSEMFAHSSGVRVHPNSKLCQKQSSLSAAQGLTHWNLLQQEHKACGAQDSPRLLYPWTVLPHGLVSLPGGLIGPADGGRLVKGCHWPWMLGESVWYGFRMRMMSWPDWFVSLVIRFEISWDVFPVMISSLTFPFTVQTTRMKQYSEDNDWTGQTTA